MSNPPPSDVNPNDDFEWTRQPYEDQFTDLSWTDGRCDQHGSPIPIRPPHLSPSFDVERPTRAARRHDEDIGVTDNPAMSDDERLLLRHAVAYSWTAFDEVMRLVDGPPASLEFKDVHQQPIRIALYRLTPEKIECLRAQIEEWEKAGILKTGSTQPPWAFPVILLRKKGGTPGTSDAYRTFIDFRQLNMVLEDDSYPLPNIAHATTFLSGKPFRSCLDMRWGYLRDDHDVRLATDDCDLGNGARRSWSSSDAVTFSSPLGTRSYLRILWASRRQVCCSIGRRTRTSQTSFTKASSSSSTIPATSFTKASSSSSTISAWQTRTSTTTSYH